MRAQVHKALQTADEMSEVWQDGMVSKAVSTHVEKCAVCNADAYSNTLSYRAWCTVCESEYQRLLNQREARRVLQLPLFDKGTKAD